MLMNELNEYEDRLWKDQSKLDSLKVEVKSFQNQTSTATSIQSDQSIQEWIEIIPFPLASILRAWFATSDRDPKTKYEHLLHFFEASSLFFAVIFLSAFRSNNAVYDENKEGLDKILSKSPIKHASFGTWKSIVEYFSKRTRSKLNGKEEDAKLVEELFYDSSLALPNMLSDTKLIEILAKTNKYRNRWTGHGGVVSEKDAINRNELLLESLNELRSITRGLWEATELLKSKSMTKKGQDYKNEVLVLMGSNSEFKSETRVMAMPLDEDVLYLHSKSNKLSLPLLPLIKMSATPPNTSNACYFYNSVSGDQVKFVSYHYHDLPEIEDSNAETREVIDSLLDIRN